MKTDKRVCKSGNLRLAIASAMAGRGEMRVEEIMAALVESGYNYHGRAFRQAVATRVLIARDFARGSTRGTYILTPGERKTPSDGG